MTLLAAALSAWLAPACAQPPPKPLREKEPEPSGVIVDEGDDKSAPKPKEEPEEEAGLGRTEARGRLRSIDSKARTAVVSFPDGEERKVSLGDSARLTFARDARPLMAGQLRPGDPVSVVLDGKALKRLHLELCGASAEEGADEDVFAPPPRRRRRPPPPPEDEEPERRSPDEPDTPMYQSEPQPPPAPPKK